jgi:hypothetical protein
MEGRWFSRRGWFYLPVSWQAGLILVLALAFCIQVFLAIDSRSHSVSDTLYGIFPYFVCTGFLVEWIASRTHGQPSS